MPRVEVGEAQKDQHDGTSAEEEAAEAGGTKNGKTEKHAMLVYVLKYELKELDEQLLA